MQYRKRLISKDKTLSPEGKFTEHCQTFMAWPHVKPHSTVNLYIPDYIQQLATKLGIKLGISLDFKVKSPNIKVILYCYNNNWVQ